MGRDIKADVKITKAKLSDEVKKNKETNKPKTATTKGK